MNRQMKKLLKNLSEDFQQEIDINIRLSKRILLLEKRIEALCDIEYLSPNVKCVELMAKCIAEYSFQSGEQQERPSKIQIQDIINSFMEKARMEISNE